MIKHKLDVIKNWLLEPFEKHDMFDWISLLTFLYVFLYLGFLKYNGRLEIWFSFGLFCIFVNTFFNLSNLKKPEFWLFIWGFVGIWLYQNNVLVDNHIFLSWFWMLNLAVVFSKPKPEQISLLRKTSALFIGIVFIAADIQRLLFNNFMNSQFFYGKMLIDSRFKFIGWLLNFPQSSIVQGNKGLLQLVKDGTTDVVVLNSGPPILKVLAKIMTYYTFVIELMLGVIFVWLFKKNSWLKHAMFIVFSLSVYVLIPIRGFSMILTLMMMTQCDSPKSLLFKGYFLWFFYNLFSISVQYL